MYATNELQQQIKLVAEMNGSGPKGDISTLNRLSCFMAKILGIKNNSQIKNVKKLDKSPIIFK